MAEVAKRKSTLDKHASRKIAHRLEEGYARQAIYEEMKQEYSDHTTLSDLIATTPDPRLYGICNLVQNLLGICNPLFKFYFELQDRKSGYFL